MSRFKVGFREGATVDRLRRNWSDDGPRPIRWSAWYPADECAVERLVVVPEAPPFFVLGRIAREATLHEGRERFPVVLLSHGTGGTASSLGWLARRLAEDGLIVVGVDHHGNTASEPYRREGFLCWWERPRDLSVTLDALAREGPFAGRMDLDRVSSAGFSLGGHTALSLSGAITDMNLFRDWAGTQPSGRGPREFPDLADHLGPLLRDSAVFRASWERQSEPNRDTRVKAAITLAPAPPVRAFTPESLRTLEPPVTIMVGDADTEAPPEPCSVWLHGQLPKSTLEFLGRDVGHYTLLGEGTDAARKIEPELFVDPPGIDRASVHAKAAEIALSALRRGSAS